MADKKRYEVLTWDSEKQKFTPQKTVRRGPYTKWGLRRALRKLRELGYSAQRGPRGSGDYDRNNDSFTLIQRLEAQ